MGKFYQCIQSYGPSFMTKFCSALYLENLLTNIFAKLNLRGGVSCMPAALLFHVAKFMYMITCTITIQLIWTHPFAFPKPLSLSYAQYLYNYAI